MKKTEIKADLPPARIPQGATPETCLPAITMARGGGDGCRRTRHRAGSQAPRIPARSVGSCKVSEVLYARVHGRVTEVLPILARGEDYDAADLCGGTFMARLKPGQRLQVDACLAALAARGALPLEPVLDDDDAPPRYRLKDGANDCVGPSTALALLDMSTNFEG